MGVFDGATIRTIGRLSMLRAKNCVTEGNPLWFTKS